MSDDSRIDTILGDWRARCDAGETLAPEDVIAAHPDLADSLRARFEALAAVGGARQPSLRDVPAERYAEFRVLGQGGMGIVYWAIDTDLNRQVAFKVVRPDAGRSGAQTPTAPIGLSPPAAGTPASQAFATLKSRFLQEAWVTAALEHPGIVPVYEVGQTPRGVPYYTMRFVRGGRTLAAALDDAKGSPIDDRLALLEPFLKVCDTIRYAHAHGVVHRDLKPENVALGEFGEVVVLDWGLAKMTGRPDAFAEMWQHRLQEYRAASDLRTLGAALGTPGYMAPEAALGRTAEVDATSDVYSLGAILFQILTGRLPYEFRSFGELATKLTRDEAPAPAALDATVPAEISAVCAKALVLDRGARTPTADALAADIRAWLAQRIENREVAALVRDARGAVAAAADLTGDFRLRQLDRAAAACSQALSRRADDPAATRLLEEIDAHRATGVEQRAREVRRAALRRVAVAALVLLVVGGAAVTSAIEQRRREAEQARAAEQAARVRAEGAEAASLALVLRTRHVALVQAARSAVAVDPTLALLLAREAAARELTPAAESALRAALDACTERCVLDAGEAYVQSLEFSPDGTRIVVAYDDDSTRIWDLGGRTVALLRTPGVETASFSPDGRRVLTLGGPVSRIWSADGALLAELAGDGASVGSGAFSPDGALVATGSSNGTARIWNAGGECVARVDHGGGAPPAGPRRRDVVSVEFSRDGGLLATSLPSSRVVRLWRTDGSFAAAIDCPAPVNEARFTPAGRSLVTADRSGAVRVWELDGTLVRVLAEPSRSPVVVPPGGGAVGISFGGGGDVVAYGVKVDEAIAQVTHVRRLDGTPVGDVPARGARFVPGGDLLAAPGEWAGDLAFWTPDGKLLQRVQVKGWPVWNFAADPNRGLFACWGGRAPASVLGRHGADVAEAEGTIECARKDDFVVASPAGGLVRCAMDGRVLARYPSPEGAARIVTIDDAGTRVAAAAGDTSVRVWTLDGESVAAFEVPGERIDALRLSPSGTRLTASGASGASAVWDASSGELVGRLPSDAAPGTPWARFLDEDHLIEERHPGKGLVRILGADGAVLLRAEASPRATSVSARMRAVLVPQEDGSIRIHDFDGNLRTTVPSGGEPAIETWPLAQSDRIVRATSSGILEFVDLEGRATVRLEPGGADVLWVTGADEFVSGWTPEGLHVWRPDGRPLVVLPAGGEPLDCFLAPSDDTFAATTHNGSVEILDRSGRRVVRFASDVASPNVRCSPGADRIAVFSYQWRAPILLFDRQGRKVGDLAPQGRQLDALETDGRHLVATFAGEGLVHVWALDPADMLELADRRAPRTLRKDEWERFEDLLGPAPPRLAGPWTGDAIRNAWILEAAALEQLAARADLDPETRRLAEERIRSRTATAEQLNFAAWGLVSGASEPEERSLYALRMAEEAVRLAPGDADILNTLGVAQYRCGKFAESLDTLTRCDAENSKSEAGAQPSDLAFLAMALHRLDRTDEATAQLIRLRDLIKTEPHAKNKESNAFLAEAASLIDGEPARPPK